MKKLSSNLKKEEVALSKGYMRWYRAVDNEIRLFVNEKAVNEQGLLLNKIYWKENRGILCVDGIEYAAKFYEAYKDYKVRFYIKAEIGALYSEYEVEKWGLCDRGIEVIFK